MRRAVILTGALRTIRKTIKFFLRNVLCDSRDNISVFVCVQNDTTETDESWTTWFQSQIGSCLKEVTWFSLDRYPGWKEHRELQLEHLVLTEAWKGYLRNSGSMIEYFQLQLAYMKMCHAESVGGFTYDYVIRARTDSIYVQPVDFRWLSWSIEEVTERVERIRTEMEASMIPTDSRGVFTHFMCSLWSEKIIPNLSFVSLDYTPAPTETVIPSTPSEIQSYLCSGRYILTIRKNNLYVVRRDLFHMIPTLGTMYGFMRSPVADNYWFNAEGQFRDACYYSCLSVFDYSSPFEERSLAYPNQWNEADFFDGMGEIIHPRMVYCVVRR